MEARNGFGLILILYLLCHISPSQGKSTTSLLHDIQLEGTTEPNLITKRPLLNITSPHHPELLPSESDTFQSDLNTDKCPFICKCQVMRGALDTVRGFTDPATNFSGGGMNLHAVDCSDTALKQIPLAIPGDTQLLKLTSNRIDIETVYSARILESLPNLRELDLENNHIYSVLNVNARLPSLTALSLDRNQIDYLANSTFWGLPNLRFFSVADNKIEIVHRDTFASLRRLQTLVMAANRISEIDVRWFRNLESLISLDLKDNSIHSLPDWAFNYLTQLVLLDLSGNQLRTIHGRAFQGLLHLQSLFLQDNSLSMVPSVALQALPTVQEINLDSNHFQKLVPGSFDSVSVVRLKLNRLKWLTLVDRQAFVNLPRLESLDMSNNMALVYIDRGAFINVPQLSRLLLANGALSTLEKPIWEALPSLETLDMNSNPLYCDCSLRWLAAAQTGPESEKAPHRARAKLSLLNAIHTRCQLPDPFTAVFLNDTAKLKSIPESCLPRLQPLFAASYNNSIGDSMSLSCKATGVPVPSIKWSLPANQKRKLDKTVTQDSINASSVRHHSQGDEIDIEFIQAKDSGDYLCVAENSQGKVTKVTTLNVQTLNTHIIVELITSHTITITWANTHHSRQYEVVYHTTMMSPNFTYHIIPIQPYMRSYTLSKLKASHSYNICIAVKYHDRDIPLNCSSVRTRSHDAQVVLDTRNYVITGAIVILAGVIVLTCLTSYLSKRYNRRREREAKLYSDSLSQLCPASPDSIADTTPMTYENRLAEMGLLDLEEAEDGEIHASTSLASFPTIQR